MGIETAIERYLQSLRAGGYSPYTVVCAGSCLRAFAAYVGTDDIPAAGDAAIDFLAFRSGRVGRNSLCASWSNVSQFLAFCVRRGWLATNPLEGARRPKKEEVVTQPLSDADILAILKEARPWERAAIVLLLGSGMRIGELAGLRWQDVGEGVLLLHGKGKRERIVAPGVSAMRELMRLPRKSDWVFPLTYESIKTALAKLSRRSGVRFHPHQLRHTFAHRFMEESNGDLEALNAILGHNSLDMTMIYLRAYRRDRALEAQVRYNPADRLFGEAAEMPVRARLS